MWRGRKRWGYLGYRKGVVHVFESRNEERRGEEECGGLIVPFLCPCVFVCLCMCSRMLVLVMLRRHGGASQKQVLRGGVKHFTPPHRRALGGGHSHLQVHLVGGITFHHTLRLTCARRSKMKRKEKEIGNKQLLKQHKETWQFAFTVLLMHLAFLRGGF